MTLYSHRLRHILISILCAFYIENAHASPWATPKGEALIISRVDYFNATTDQSRFSRYELNTYGEYGLSDKITIGAKLIGGRTTSTFQSEAIATDGVTEAEIFFQTSFFRNKRHAIALRTAAIRPANIDSGARPGLISSGIDSELSIGHGVSFYNFVREGYNAVEVGYRRRAGASDQVITRTSTGFSPTKSVVLSIDTFGFFSSAPSTAKQNFDIINIQPAVRYQIASTWSIQLGASQEVYGRNVLTGRRFFLGVWKRFGR